MALTGADTTGQDGEMTEMMSEKQQQFLWAVIDCETKGKDAENIWLYYAKRCADRKIETDHEEFSVLFSWAKRNGFISRKPIVMEVTDSGHVHLNEASKEKSDVHD